jgi:hypothetical protein
MPRAIKSVTPSAQVLFQKVGAEAVLLDLKSEQYFGLDEVGTRIWELLMQHRDLRQVERIMVVEYDAPAEKIAGDLKDLVQKLIDADLLTVDQGA